MERYSIIIPTYNEEKSINRLLINLKFLNDNGHEIIIVNDGSTDFTGQILNQHKHIRAIHYKSNKGKGRAIKVGLRKASYNAIIIFDSDRLRFVWLLKPKAETP